MDIRRRLTQKKSWVLYDWAKSAFATTVIATLLPIYFSNVAYAGTSPQEGTQNWAFATVIGMVLTSFSMPLLGSMADLTGTRKRMLLVFTTLGITATALLYFVKTGDWALAFILYVAGNVGYSAGSILYDSMLRSVTTIDEIEEVSCQGYAYGYLGGGIMLGINVLMVLYLPSLLVAWFPDLASVSEGDMSAWMVRLSFVTVAIWWLIFTIPFVKNVSESDAHKSNVSRTPLEVLSISLEGLMQFITDASRYKEVYKFLGAFLVYNTGISTIFYMASSFANELGFRTTSILGTMLLVQFIAFPATLAAGKLSKRIGTKTTVTITIILYAIIAIAGYFMTSETDFLIIALAVGMIQGGSQALSRALFAKMMPGHKSSQFFSILGVGERLTSTVGPFVVALISQTIFGSRSVILLLVALFLIGAGLLQLVDERLAFAVARVEEQRYANEMKLQPGTSPSGELLQNQS